MAQSKSKTSFKQKTNHGRGKPGLAVNGPAVGHAKHGKTKKGGITQSSRGKGSW